MESNNTQALQALDRVVGELYAVEQEVAPDVAKKVCRLKVEAYQAITILINPVSRKNQHWMDQEIQQAISGATLGLAWTDIGARIGRGAGQTKKAVAASRKTQCQRQEEREGS